MVFADAMPPTTEAKKEMMITLKMRLPRFARNDDNKDLCIDLIIQ